MKSPFKGKPDIRKYSILPARAMQDKSLSLGELRVLACLGMFTNSYGVCWPSQMRMAVHLGYTRVWVSKCVASLIKKGYIRKLEPRAYPKGIKRRSARIVNRYQVLFCGNEALPSKEQFWAPQPRFETIPEDDVYDEATPIRKGVQGDGNKDYQALAHTFKKAVEKSCGVHRLPDASFKAAKVLWDQGITPDQVRDSTAAFVREALKAGRTPPLTLDQVAKWAALYKK